MYENINAIFESRKHYHPLKIKPSARSVYSKLNANIYAENYTSWQSISSINADDFRYSSLLSLFLENSSQKILVWIFDAEHFSRFDGQIERAQHRSLERSWEIFWQPKWVSVSSVMSRSIRSLQTVYPQWVKIAPHIDATGIRGIIDACVYVCVYIYILPSVSCHFPRLGTRFCRSNAAYLEIVAEKIQTFPTISFPSLEKKKSTRLNIIKLDESLIPRYDNRHVLRIERRS